MVNTNSQQNTSPESQSATARERHTIHLYSRVSMPSLMIVPIWTGMKKYFYAEKSLSAEISNQHNPLYFAKIFSKKNIKCTQFLHEPLYMYMYIDRHTYS